MDAWEKGLADDSMDDRLALAKIFKSPKFKYGYVELEKSDADGALRSLTGVALVTEGKRPFGSKRLGVGDGKSISEPKRVLG